MSLFSLAGSGLLVAQGGGRRDGTLGILAVGLVRSQVLLKLLLLGLGLSDGGLQLGLLVLGRSDGGRQVGAAGLAVAHELLEELLIALTLRDDLLLHVLHHGDHPSNRVRSAAGVGLAG